MAREKLAPAEIAAALASAPAWILAHGGASISRGFAFRNFSEAFAFMTRIAMLAEKLDHHPDLSNVYRTVQITLTTHDAGGLTALDFDMARRINRIAPAA